MLNGTGSRSVPLKATIYEHIIEHAMQNSQSVDGSDLHWQMVRRSYVTDGTKTNHID